MRRCVILLLMACGTSERPDPLPLDVDVVPVGSATVSIDSLRLAVAHRTVEGFFITTDVSVTATGTPVRLTLPSPEVEGIFNNAILAIIDQRFVVGIPDLVAYLDLDGSASLDTGVDRVLGLAGASRTVAWIGALETQLAGLSPESTAEYYRQTGDRYTPFMHVERAGDRFYLPSEPTQISVDITEAALAGTQLACGLEQIGLVETAAEVRLSIHDALDLGPLCDVGVGTCESVDVPSLDPVELERAPVDAYLSVRVQCSRRGALVALVVEEQRLRCDATSCRCARATTVDSVITSTSALPPWWPCGERLEYCAANGPLYLIDPACM